MSSYIKKFSHLKLHELIEICESKSDHYTEQAKEAALTIIELKDPEIEEIKEAAITYWNNKINLDIKSLILNGHIPKSDYLNSEEIISIMKNAYEKWKSKQELLGIDTTKYWAWPF